MGSSTKYSGTSKRTCVEKHTVVETVFVSSAKSGWMSTPMVINVEVRCDSPFQDEHYGKGVRLMNNDEKGGCTCTVCGKKHFSTKEEPKSVVKGKK